MTRTALERPPRDVDLVVRNGTLIRSSGTSRADILVAGSRIAAVYPGTWDGRAREELDASGMLIFPGLIDAHVHLMDPGDLERETFPSGTAAAAAAGVTTIVEHTHAWPVNDVDRLAEKRSYLRGRSHVDFGLAAHVWPDRLSQLASLWAAGVTFFKVFTCTTHGVPGLLADSLLETFDILASMQAPSLVHCEDELLTVRSERLLRSAGRYDPGLLLEWRTREAELLAVAQVAMLARVTRAPVCVAHASTPEVLAVVREERARGAPLTAETCPQYLLLREDEIHDHGACRKFTPPARIRSDHDRRRMWASFNDGDVDQVSSDHAPSTLAAKQDVDFWSAPFGLPGLDTTFPLMLDAALSGETSLPRLAAAYAEAPAQRLRLSRKGQIAPGMDADMVVVDPHSGWVVSNETVRSKAGWSPYDGRRVRGRVMATVLRGDVIYRDGVLAEERRGLFLAGPGAVLSEGS